MLFVILKFGALLLGTTFLVLFGLASLGSWWLGFKNPSRRAAVLAALPRTELQSSRPTIIVGFFHPYCDAGGGGERVLWVAIAYLQRTEPNVVSVVYTGDVNVSKESIISKVETRFGISLDPSTLAFAYLPSRYLVDDKTWTRFTLLGQSLGSMILGWEAINSVVPDIFIDTMGYAFTYPLLRVLRVKAPMNGGTIPIGAYVHYPTISTDMLRRVKSREEGVTNDSGVAGSVWKSSLKFRYYQLFAIAYSGSLALADDIVVNGTWTKNHVDLLLASSPLSTKYKEQYKTKDRKTRNQRGGNGVPVVYPPCNTESLQTLSLLGRERILLSVAQFRPEKNHPAQLRALKSLLDAHPEYRLAPGETLKKGSKAVKMVLLGSVRNEEDAVRVAQLKSLAQELGITDNLQFVENASYPELVDWLRRSSIGISSMIDEHFGINVVEFMAAGLIPVVHASAGPLLDIVTPISGKPTGFFYYSDPTSAKFANSLHEALSLNKAEETAMRKRDREGAKRFGREPFEATWGRAWDTLKERVK